MAREAAKALPQHLQRRPATDWQWPFPTAWLLGTKLLGSLRDMLLSSVAHIDLRNWMTADEVVDLTTRAETDGGEECFYVDFLADTGDSQRMVYQLARLLMQKRLQVHSWQRGEPKIAELPRGSLLVFGGDTAYPVATHRRLLERICAPFAWAHDELSEDERKELEVRPVSFLALPGNHDYYDGLRGFEALTHTPPVLTSPGPSRTTPPSQPRLEMCGYKREQHASYFAAALPFGWHLWGLDIETHKIDDRQLAFFEYARTWKPGIGPQRAQSPRVAPAPERTQDQPRPPDRLILVTSRPAFVYQGLSDHAKIIEASLARLDLPRPFAHNGTLDGERVRLDLSGDVHVYERYWGTDHKAMPDDVDRVREADDNAATRAWCTGQYEAPERYRESGAGPTTTVRRRGNDPRSPRAAHGCANYASVVSGLGGAFHHPSQVRMGTTPPRTAWPSAEHSAREIGVRLVDPYETFRSGAVGIVGLLLSMACYLLVWSTRSTEPSLVNVLDVLFKSFRDAELRGAACQLGLVAVSVVLAVATVALPIATYYLGRRLVAPIREMCEPSSWWLKRTHAFTHAPRLQRFWRFLGGNPRSTWLFFATLPLWLAMLAAGGALIYAFDAVIHPVHGDGRVIVYVLITLVVVGMAALGAFRGGQKARRESWPANLGRRAALCGFGAVIGMLVMWTPYAWVRLMCGNPLVGALAMIAVLATMMVRVGNWVFPRGLATRRAATWLGFLALVAGAVLVPKIFAHMDEPHTPSQFHYAVMVPLVMFFGAYFACLWVGWYFCICLQWNAHGNEAGSAARVTAFGEFVRIKLTKDQAEVWTIAVEEELDPAPPRYLRWLGRKATRVDGPKARLIDHFTVAAPGARR